MTPEELTRSVKQGVKAVDPAATVLLYGSRARGAAEPDSDWDFLILLSVPASLDIQRQVRLKLCEVEWATGEVITCTIHSQTEWDEPRFQAMPFRQNVAREGIVI